MSRSMAIVKYRGVPTMQTRCTGWRDDHLLAT